ncbi:MAG: carbamoyltransferase C-terminal domain-containing protein [Bacteroidota bacterium]
MSTILGIGGSDHDFSAAIIKDGKLQIAVEDERLTRIKHASKKWDSSPTKPSIDYCFEKLQIDLSHIDGIYSNLHLVKRVDDLKLPNVKKISHHLSHAASSYFTSYFDTSSLVVIDGAGNRVQDDGNRQDLETISIGYANGNKLDLELTQTGNRFISTRAWLYKLTNSIGAFYNIITEAIGFSELADGKTMGLSSYGSDRLVHELKDFVAISRTGGFEYDPYGGIWDWLVNKISNSKNKFQIRADIARAGQEIFEEAVFSVLKFAHKRNPSENLSYSGGCALNSVANAKIPEKTPFENVHIFSAPSDSGTSVGAALYGYYCDMGFAWKKHKVEGLGKIAYTGRTYNEENILTALDKYPVHYRKLDKKSETIAKYIWQGKVIGWFQSGSEFGPRALGNRSILADPTKFWIRDHINLKVKKRETFRPFAPVVILNKAKKFFELNGPSPMMLNVVKVKPPYDDLLPAITHVDGTARIQTLDEMTNPPLYELIREFEKLSGFPILLNTSFNIQGEPIVETPENAIASFLETNIDILVLENYVVEKHTPWAEINL